VKTHVLKKCKELPGITKNQVENKKRLLAECISYIEKNLHSRGHKEDALGKEADIANKTRKF